MVQRGPAHVISAAGMRSLLPAYAEGGPPTDVADRINASMTVPFVIPLAIGMTQATTAADRYVHDHARLRNDLYRLHSALLEGLKKRGFKLWSGERGGGMFELAYSRGGGYYINHGASELIVDGSIKLKTDGIDRFDKHGIVFADGSTLSADVVVWATGFEDPTVGIRRLIAPKDVEGMKPVWGVDDEGEWRTFWRPSGVDGLHVMGSKSIHPNTGCRVDLTCSQPFACAVLFQAPCSPYVTVGVCGDDSSAHACFPGIKAIELGLSKV
jgi:putative flavoprotein involved in K+ transport